MFPRLAGRGNILVKLMIIIILVVLSVGCLNQSHHNREEIVITFVEGTSIDEAKDLMNEYYINDYIIRMEAIANETGTYNVLVIYIDVESIENKFDFCQKMKNESIVAYCEIEKSDG